MTVEELEIADDPERWSNIGFAVENRTVYIGTVTVKLTDSPDKRGFLGWSLDGLASLDIDGLPTRRASCRTPRAAAKHPNGATKIDHIVALTPDRDRTVQAARSAGLILARLREGNVPIPGRQAFFRLGELIFEVMEPAALSSERHRKTRFWGFAVETEDLDATAAFLGEKIGPARPAVQGGRTIAPLNQSAGLAIPLAFISGNEGPDEAQA